jgi:6-pyruvoyl-tetrahydropterin synthase
MILFVRDLTVIDAAYLCPHRGIVGDSWLVDVELTGELNEMSMLFDFARVKKQLKAIIDTHVDHRLLVPQKAPETMIEPAAAGYLYVDFLSDDHTIHLHCPDQAFAIIPDAEITTESVTDYLLALIREQLPGNIDGLTITLRHEAIPTPSYHYTHGLKKHDGNCQRIAHGHRSMIELWVDGVRDHSLEQYWATRWQDIYLGTAEDLVSLSELELSETGLELANDEQHYCFRYRSAQGDFQLAIPKESCEIIETDTTVELLAAYIARQLKPQLDHKKLKVVAYEGVGKGAIELC